MAQVEPKSRFFIISAGYDLSWFIAPAFFSIGLAYAAYLGMPGFDTGGDTPLWAWLVFILVADVAHVWSTIYRVYLDSEERVRRPWLYYGTPAGVFISAFLLYFYAGHLIFWRVMAYLALFHFVRQQVGFVALYRQKLNEHSRFIRHFDNMAVYVGTLVPLYFWHSHERNFSWFIEGDFFHGLPAGIMPLLWVLYSVYGGMYLLVYGYIFMKTGVFNIGKHMTMLATWAVYYTGIVALNFDFAFTVTNVLIHGIAYTALVYALTRRHTQKVQEKSRLVELKYFSSNIFRFLGLILLLAFAEEFLWDNFLWHEKPELFGGIYAFLPEVLKTPLVTVFMVALLSVPQVTHYILDGFIWKFSPVKNPDLKKQVVSS